MTNLTKYTYTQFDTKEPALLPNSNFMIYSPIEHDRTAREVEKQIESLILEGVLSSGDKLPGERELSKVMEVSRPIVREALGSLELRGLLSTKHGDGTFIADVIGTVFAPPVVDLISTNAKAKSDYLEYRREIESITAALAAKRATNADKALLQRIIEDMELAHQKPDPPKEAALDVEFHNAIGECAHNIILLHTLKSCYRLLSDDVFYNRGNIYDMEGARDVLLQQHRAIFDAIMASNSENAASAAEKHIEFVERASVEVEQKGKWNMISELRLAQRDEKQQKNKKRS